MVQGLWAPWNERALSSGALCWPPAFVWLTLPGLWLGFTQQFVVSLRKKVGPTPLPTLKPLWRG